jgi:hypothetical protein
MRLPLALDSGWLSDLLSFMSLIVFTIWQIGVALSNNLAGRQLHRRHFWSIEHFLNAELSKI